MLAVVFTVAGVVTVFAQGLGGRDGLRPPGALAVVTAVLTCSPVALRRRAPLPALLVSTAAIAVHILADWPEGSLPLAVLFLTYSVGAWCRLRTAVVGLVAAEAAIVVLGATGSMGLDAVDVFTIVAQFAAAWAVGVAVRNRRAATDARVREASERAEVEREQPARRVAEERLRIARELHDVVAHSMSRDRRAGRGRRPRARRAIPTRRSAALETISARQPGALAECAGCSACCATPTGRRRPTPAPGLERPRRRWWPTCAPPGVPVDAASSRATPPPIPPGVELVRLPHRAGGPDQRDQARRTPARVTCRAATDAGSIAVEVVDDGDGRGPAPANGGGHGLVGMRERVGRLRRRRSTAGPRPGGGYRVAAPLPVPERR